ncbi:nitrite/sulfite reductase [Candidatus Haliotispira prima]|uniref:Nitrite/sulfite reductase n=1 Tax=Candidatus Haliotispira prima TaxID=3034016 RepID=A0ABY8MDL7_9SPIO|nr:nitrite/sulfite reductase [Candidatus Haliotispira prima]
MLRKLTYERRSEEEEIKDTGLTLDLDEIARKGAMSPEEKSIAKWYGIYGSRQPGAHMARIVIPGGVVTSAQARNIAKVSEDYAQGKLNVTTRQALQFHWLGVGKLADMVRDLDREQSSTFHGCGDVTRNVAVCPMAESCPHARLNVMPDAVETAEYLTGARDLDNLPRKFKISFSGCSGGCAQPFINCIGNIAVQTEIDGKTVHGYRMVIGGGMGWKAFVAQELFSFVPAERIKDVCRAVALLFRDHGDRYNRAKSRLKWVVERQGIDFCRTVVLDFLKKEGISTEGLHHQPLAETGPAIPDRPLAELSEQGLPGKDGKMVARALVPKGELTCHQLLAMAGLSEVYGDQRVRTTNRQNLELHGIESADLETVKAEIRKIGFGTDGFHTIRDMVPCVGTDYCPKAVAKTRGLYDILEGVVSREKYKDIQKKVLVNITGCPNSCSPYRISDIGFRGERIREESGSVEGFEILLGGDQMEQFGHKLGNFKTVDCPKIVETVLDEFILLRQSEETLADTVGRVGMEPFRKAVFV